MHTFRTNRTETLPAPAKTPIDAPSDASLVEPAARRAALDAQKRYMDDRFGRDRPMGRRRTA